MSGYIAAEAPQFRTNVESQLQKKQKKVSFKKKTLTVICSRSFNSCTGNSGNKRPGTP